MKTLIIAGLLALTQPSVADIPDFGFEEMDYTPQKTTFRLYAPSTFKTVKVHIYKDGQGGRPLKTVSLSPVGKDFWVGTVTGDQKGHFYAFQTPQGQTPGVFAKAVGVNGQRGAIIDMRDTDPAGWQNDSRPVVKNPADLVVYELHHRDFSIARRDAQHPGKFLALTEPWAITHLKELGINAVHILPSYDFGSIDETRLEQPQYNWGYDPVNYNVPEGSYSTNPYDPLCRNREFKQMVAALHRAGIAVILDVVYNHTYDIGHSNFQKTYPDYYYRKVKDGEQASGSTQFSYSNSSGCGNETASEQPMMRRFMMESVRYWVQEYHIDGFRFDLMGCHDIETMNQIRKALDDIDPTIFVYGEGWSAGACALPTEQLGVKANIPQMPGIAAFSDDIRDALRGPFSDDTKCGWLGYKTIETVSAADEDRQTELSVLQESLKAGLVGMIAHPQVDYSKVNYSKQPYALQPTQMISYVSCHDDMCLVDRLKASIPACNAPSLQHSYTPALLKLDLLAQTAVFTSQGVPFMLSGEELLRTKQGVHNSYISPDSINQLCWENKTRYPQVFEYYKNLIALRKHHPAFRLGSADLVRKHLEFLKTPGEGVVAFRLKNYAGRDDWRNIIVVLNACPDAVEVSVPSARYTVVCADGVINEQGLRTVSGNSVTVSSQSALILHD